MYATLIYQSLGWDAGSQALAINGIQSVLQLLIVLVNTFTVDRFGRRGLLIVGFSIQALALLIMSCLCTAYPSNENKAAAVVEVAMLFIVGLTYCWSNGPIAAAVVSEIFPQHVRDRVSQTSCIPTEPTKTMHVLSCFITPGLWIVNAGPNMLAYSFDGILAFFQY